MPRRIWTEPELIKACETSVTYGEVLQKLGMVPVGGNYKTIKKYIEILKIDVSHFLGRGASKFKNGSPYKINLREVLIENCEKYIRGATLKKRLIEEKLLKNECYICGLTKWLGNPITLHMDHINGNNKDNRLENLRILCPNCHSQTDTYCGKNIKKHSHLPKIIIEKFCIDCNVKVSKKSKRCKKCEALRRQKEEFKIEWPSDEEIFKMYLEKGVSKTAKIIGCSHSGVQKRLEKIKRKMGSPELESG